VNIDFQLVLLALGACYVVAASVLWLKRRGRMREFAAAHGLRFRGTLPSDKYDPYRRFPRVQSSVLLYSAMEGRWEDFETALFDYYFIRGRLSTGVIMSLPTDSSSVIIRPGAAPDGVGPRTAAQLAEDPSVYLETSAGYLFASPRRKLDVDALREFLAFAASLARALEADAKAAGPGQ
jgi:hypothetical protein